MTPAASATSQSEGFIWPALNASVSQGTVRSTVSGAARQVPSRPFRLLALSRSLMLGLRVAYLRWLDVHPASRAGQRHGDLAFG